MHTEYGVPAEQLREFNAQIVGFISVVEQFGSASVSRRSRSGQLHR